ncbi:MAG: hypothetical protein WCL70_09170 [Paludibacter sp.]
MKKLIFFVLVCGVMSACTSFWPFSQSEHFYIPSDKKPVLKNNAFVYFQDSLQANKVDTFQLDVKDKLYQDTENDYWEYYYILYNKINQKTTFFNCFITTRTVDRLTFGITISSLYYYPNRETINYSIHGKDYSDVKIAHLNSVNTSDTVPNNIYFSYLNGIIRYEYKDGRVYNLVSK